MLPTWIHVTSNLFHKFLYISNKFHPLTCGTKVITLLLRICIIFLAQPMTRTIPQSATWWGYNAPYQFPIEYSALCFMQNATPKCLEQNAVNDSRLHLECIFFSLRNPPTRFWAKIYFAQHMWKTFVIWTSRTNLRTFVMLSCSNHEAHVLNR